MTLDQIRLIHSIASGGNWIDAARAILYIAGIEKEIESDRSARVIVRQLVQSLLDSENYEAAATLLWGEDLFNARPAFVHQIFDAIHKYNLLGIQGSCSCSKSFSSIAWMYLDWYRDPDYTAVKLAAVNDEQSKKQMFSHVLTLHRACLVPVVDDEKELLMREHDMHLGLRRSGEDFGITCIAFSHANESGGQFRGYKTKPYRKISHPKWGKMTRLRVLGDETSSWKGGPFLDFNSIMGSMSGDLVKITCLYNPTDVSSPMLQRAEPEEGWTLDGMDYLYEWKSKKGWNIIRLDGAKCENVVERRLLYPGFQTYDAHIGYLSSGDSSYEYFVGARGWPPISASANVIIPPAWANDSRGEAIYVEKTTNWASCDLAYDGGDNPIMATGRWGLASGFRRANGDVVKFPDRHNPGQYRPRHVLQIDQLLSLIKSNNTIDVADDIKGKCSQLGIKPEWVVLDKTGVGFGTWSHLKRYWGDVLGIMWAERATEHKVLSEDQEVASERFDLVGSEMWFTFRHWIDPIVCAILINPIVPTTPLNTQMTSRRFRPIKGGKRQVESKLEYKKRNQHSPDEMDACVMAPMLIRQRGNALPGMVEQETHTDEGEEASNEDEAIESEKDDFSPLSGEHADTLLEQ